LVKNYHLIWPLFRHQNELISSSTQSQYLKTTPPSDLYQNMLIPASLATNWNETERFGLFFTKTLVFMPKSGSINSGTGVSGHGLVLKRAFWACFRENDHFHTQNWIYKFGHGKINACYRIMPTSLNMTYGGTHTVYFCHEA
jgi:hypothetical protein